MSKYLLSLIAAFLLVSCSPAIVDGQHYEYNNTKLFSGLVDYTLPNTWEKEQPSSQMRLAQFNLPGEEKSEDAELAVYLFPGMGGSIDANLQRWYKQFEQKDGKDSAELANKEHFNIGKIPLTKIYLTGTYLQSKAPMMMRGPKVKKKNYAMLAAIAETEEGPWFFKAIGPQKTIEQHRSDFDTFVNSFRLK